LSRTHDTPRTPAAGAIRAGNVEGVGDSPAGAIRATIAGNVQGVGFREATRRRAHKLGVTGWVRNVDDGTVLLHAEGPATAIEALVSFLRKGPPGAAVTDVGVQEVRSEGHEQFAIRGVSAGVFVVQQHAATARHFDLRLEVAGVMRSWAVPKGPSLDPSVKRLAVEVEDHEIAHNAFEGPTDHGGVIVWDRGRYEQGGRVAWPEALERGHAVFVLHGEKLGGGFALQRTGRAGGAESGRAASGRAASGAAAPGRVGVKSQWLLLKRRDDDACPGSDIVAEQPASVLSGRTLDELLGEGA
jgi:DNA ligase D-like protein (predicted 3'-phosphoesterase)